MKKFLLQEEEDGDELCVSRVDPRMENQEIHEMKHQQQQQQQQALSLPPSSQQWATGQPEYIDGPTSMMEINSGEIQTDWQPLSLPTNIQDTYDPSAQYMRGGMDMETVQYQQPEQQDYWNQQPYYQGSYGRNEPGQAEMDDSQRQDKWNYEVR